MPAPARRAPSTRAPSPPRLQRACAGCAEKQDQEQVARRAHDGRTGPALAPEIVGEVLGSGTGRALDAGTRAYFEPRFGHDFAEVRVHDDRRADESARSVRALAYTVGSHVVFRAGAFSPATAHGRRLLAHELAHVVQQADASPRSWAPAGGRSSAPAGGAASRSLAVVPAGDRSEREADRIADAVVRADARAPAGGREASPHPAPRVARQADSEEEPAAAPEAAVEDAARVAAPAVGQAPAPGGQGGEVIHSTARSPEEDPEIIRARGQPVPAATVTCVRKWQPCRAPYSPGTWAARMTYHCPRLILPWGIILPGTTRPAFATIPDEFIGVSPTGRDMYRCRPRSTVMFRATVADAAATGITRSMLFFGQAACHAGYRANLHAALEVMFKPSGGGRPAGIRVNSTPPGGGGIPFPCP